LYIDSSTSSRGRIGIPRQESSHPFGASAISFLRKRQTIVLPLRSVPALLAGLPVLHAHANNQDVIVRIFVVDINQRKSLFDRQAIE
jgi:hypothetical protein